MPRNLFTAAVADGKVVVVPTTTPDASVTVGAAAAAKADWPNRTETSWMRRIVMDGTR